MILTLAPDNSSLLILFVASEQAVINWVNDSMFFQLYFERLLAERRNQMESSLKDQLVSSARIDPTLKSAQSIATQLVAISEPLPETIITK